MANPKNQWTPELAVRLHGAVGLLFAAATFVFICTIPLAFLSLAFFSDGGVLLLLPFGASCCLFIGMMKLRSVTAELAYGAQRAPRRESFAAPEAPLPAFDTAPVVKPPVRAAKSAVLPPAATMSGPAQWKTGSAAKKKAPAKPAIEWEEWVGQKLLQKVGIVVVLIGMLVLLQQAFENRWIDELGRVFLASVAAAALLVAGEFFQKKYAQWSQGFTGGGLALAYLAVWVAHVLYADALVQNYGFAVPASVAFILYAGITAVGALLSIRYNAPTVAWFAVAGGYLTPLLVDAPTPDPYVFGVYLAVLAGGLLALSAYRHWQGIVIASFLLTQFYLVSIYDLPSLSNTTQSIFAIGFFVLFAVLPLVRHFRLGKSSTPEELLLIVGNAFTVFVAVQDALGGWQSEWVTLLCLAIAAFTVACAVAALRTRSSDAILGDTYLLGSIALIALALLHQLGWEWLAIGWGPFAAVTAYLAVSIRRKSVWVASGLLLAGTAAAMLTNMPLVTETASTWRPFLSNWSLQGYVVFASLIALLHASSKAPKEFSDGLDVSTVLHALVALLTFGMVTFEVTALHWHTSVPLGLAYLVFAAAACMVFAFTRQVVWFLSAILAQIIVFIFTFVRGDGLGMDAFSLLDKPHVTQFPLVHPWALVSLVATLTLVGLLAVSQRGEEHPFLPRVRVRHMILGMIVAQVWLHMSVEIRHVSMWFALPEADYHRALSLWWLIVAGVVAHIAWTPQWRKVAVALFALPFAKDMVRIAAENASMRDVIAWTLIALAVACWGAKTKRRELLVAGLVGLLGTGAIDMLAHAAHDTGLLRSVWWAVAGLLSMSAGFALRTKELRQASIAIFGVTVAKLLLVDFSALETPVRIVASIATGLLLIGASYLYQRYGTSPNE